jgi:NAD(P)H-hydrate epimerase
MTLPAWLAPLYDADAMRAADRRAIEEHGIPGPELMERAGAALARAVERVAPAGPVAIVCGTGNNGGDGYVAARLLRGAGRVVTVLATGAPREGSDAADHAGRLPGEPAAPFSPAGLDGAAAIVDALLGTGFADAPRGAAADAIAGMNAAGAPVVACDVPSGVDASTGAVAGDAVRAHLTVTFAGPKTGLWIAPGKAHAGEVVVADIGIDPDVVAPTVGLIDDGVLSAYPRRGPDATKFASGHVLVAGGSRGMTGAPSLAAAAAMRAGAGYVTACVPAALNDIFEVKLTEVMSLPLPDADGGLTAEGAAIVAARARERGGALVLGPGLGRADGAVAFARDLAHTAAVPLVLDADGLNAHAGRLEGLAARPAPTILTPHAGELARLLEIDSATVGARRLEHARDAARRSGAIVVLKGDDTLVAEPGGRVGVSRGGSPALATAGTGDVLSGILGALLGRGMAPWHAACAGVLVHARAGRRAAAARGGPDGVIASDVVEELSRSLGRVPPR